MFAVGDNTLHLNSRPGRHYYNDLADQIPSLRMRRNNAPVRLSHFLWVNVGNNGAYSDSQIFNWYNLKDKIEGG